jgi:NTE family protein
VGIIRALDDAKVPIGAVLGTEMGGFIGALYAMSRNVNQFEWGLLKFKENAFLEVGGLFSKKRRLANGKQLAEQLSLILKERDLNESKIPLRIALQWNKGGSPVVVDHGKAAHVLHDAVMESRGSISPNSRPFLIQEAQSLAIGPVVVVDVMRKSDSVNFMDELKKADLVIKPNMGGIGDLDFEKRTDAAFRGKKAIQQNLTEIRRLVGLPENDFERNIYP